MGKAVFGYTADHREVYAFELTNRNGSMVRILSYGGAIQSWLVPDAPRGTLTDIVLGFPTVEAYENQRYFGALIGRCANRIPDGVFSLNGKTYTLACNDSRAHTHLHGGVVGFNQRLWDGTLVDSQTLELRLRSPDGEEGYPGNLDLCVTYTLNDANELHILYEGVCDQDTVLSMTNHAYFNLCGEGNGLILDHELQILADQFTANGADNAANGELIDVAGTPHDFRTLKRIGRNLFDETWPHTAQVHGYDSNFVLSGAPRQLTQVALLREPASGRTLCLATTMPGMQLYTANMLDGHLIGKSGRPYQAYAGVCLEAQNWPNAINSPHFPSPVLRAGERYCQEAVYTFAKEDV